MQSASRPGAAAWVEAASMQEDDRRPGMQGGDEARRELEARLRRVAHDINGALNTLALNVELLDRAAAADVREDAAQAARDRCLASLRRAVGEIQSIVRDRLLPLSGGDSASGRDAN